MRNISAHGSVALKQDLSKGVDAPFERSLQWGGGKGRWWSLTLRLQYVSRQ